jgi:hypothetical protein
MIDNLFGLVNKFVPDADKAKELEAQIKTAQEEALKQAVAADKEVRLAELRKGRYCSSMATHSCPIFIYYNYFPLVNYTASAGGNYSR